MTPTPSKPAKWWNRAPDKPAGEALNMGQRILMALGVYRDAMPAEAVKAFQAIASTPPPSTLDEEEAIEAGVVVLRDWMSENWGDIKDGAETGMREAVRTLISLKDRETD